MDIDITKVKHVELEILKEFIRVCEELGLQWYAAYGTVLGAVRHKGFIPWDDDIDVLMPRKDYEVFCEKAQGILKQEYFVQTLATEKEYYNPFAKLRRTDTTFWGIGTKDDNINHGIYVDIFPLDGYPTNWLAEKRFMLKRIVYNNFLAQNGNLNELQGYRKYVAILYRLLKGTLTRKEAAMKKDRLAKEIPFEEAALVSCMVEDKPKAEALPSSVYGEGTELVFEDMNIRVPLEYEVYLRKMYGDYMQFPPEDERVPLHKCVLIDADKSYLEYHF